MGYGARTESSSLQYESDGFIAECATRQKPWRQPVESWRSGFEDDGRNQEAQAAIAEAALVGAQSIVVNEVSEFAWEVKEGDPR
jgi:hypothetical protein